MSTLRHKRLAKNLGKSRTMKEAMIKSDYSESYAESPNQIRETTGFKEENKPLLERYQKELQAILDAMELKDKNSEEYKVLVDAADKVQKQIQLLGGKPTERVEYKPIYAGESIKTLPEYNSDSQDISTDKED